MPIDLALAARDEGRQFFRPGDTVRLRVAWRTDAVPDRVDVCLAFRTAGQGTSDFVSVASDTRGDAHARPGSDETWDVTLTLPPESPPTYYGRLLTIGWIARAEMHAAGGKGNPRESAELPLIVSPTGQPLVPQRLAHESQKARR